MGELKIGRAVAAALHQAISELLPTRIQFYEEWLTLDRIREGTVSRAKVGAVLSFLRQESSGYDQVVERAGRYTGVWTFDTKPRFCEGFLQRMPQPIRVWIALRRGASLIKGLHDGGRLRWATRRGVVVAEIQRSLFCEVRVKARAPLCRFYAALLEYCLESVKLSCSIELIRCRGVGDKVCELRIDPK
ncbi:MAG: hypothetical protein CL484_06500 [Acidobacteria bacterium]|nr:hypothetical protein [Acidobacteriota bacterium]|tara:strand:+ start:4903 stop:5469 length:567 start_codon:yes stop_codon:yes gene_type:complete